MSQRINIIIAEDQKLVRQGFINLLQEYNIFTIAEAQNGVELLAILKEKQADVILLDLEMPEMDGTEALAEVNKRFPGQKIIILTMHNSATLKEYFYELGVKAFLDKNIDSDLLAETIRLVHRNKYEPELSKQNENELKISKRESEVTNLVCDGLSNKEIADKLNITDKTVEAHKTNLFEKTNTKSVGGFVSYIIKKGLYFLRY